jgi:hypothetical protein
MSVKMVDPYNHKTSSSSILEATLARVSARIAPLLKDELAGALISELERHFNEKLLPELHERVEAIVARELEKREAVDAPVWPANQPSTNGMTLYDRFSRVFHENLWADGETMSGPGSRRTRILSHSRCRR